jgi:hypothetical protein
MVPETLKAIERFESTIFNSTLPIDCSDPLLDRIKSDLHYTLTKGKLTATVNPQAGSTAVIGSEIAEMRSQIYNIDNTLKSVHDSFSSYFATQFQSLTQMGVSAFATAISILIAFAALIGNNIIKDSVKAAHEREIERSKNELRCMINIAQSQIYAGTHTSLSSSFTGLYEDLDPKARDYLYRPYVSAAVDMARKGYRKAQVMYKFIEDSQASEKVGAGEPKLDEYQSSVMNMSLNNYAYFLADMTTLKKDDKVTSTQEAIAAKSELRSLLPKLEAVLASRLASSRGRSSDYVMEEIYLISDTIIWVKLHLNLAKTASGAFNQELELLKNNSGYSEDRKNYIATKYEKHKKNFPELWPPTVQGDGKH